MKAIVTIIIPTYNHANMLKNAIQSIINQSFDQWIAIIVNNYSTDNTEEVVNSFNDKRIVLVNFSNNGVIAASRNYGMKIAETEYIAFLDSDDIWYKNKLEICMNHIQNKYDLVCHGEAFIYNNKKIRERIYGPEKNATYEKLFFRGNELSPSAVVLKLSVARMVNFMSENTTFITAEDYDFWLKIMYHQIKIKFINDVLGEYHLHDKNESKNVEKNSEATMSVLNEHYYKNIKKNLINRIKYRQRLAVVYYVKSKNYVEVGKFYKGYENLLMSVFMFPRIFRCFYLILFSFRVFIKMIVNPISN
ncbi:glycosyltransferase family 2 protein [Fluviispira vulneris]|uniref:glycosyltransferase family 2 protein n=1 Tax=Fluviispira vulneris TaxID=2763012 RepID=UPI001647104C|nr:glycosyltransferase family 2 protein [Fluviispira vulneris]